MEASVRILREVDDPEVGEETNHCFGISSKGPLLPGYLLTYWQSALARETSTSNPPARPYRPNGSVHNSEILPGQPP